MKIKSPGRSVKNALKSEIISDLSAFFTLLPGDLIFTGTPEGVGPVFPGDVLEAKIAELPCLSVAIQ